MVGLAKVLRVYCGVLAAVALMLMPFADAVPDNWALLFNIFAFPTAPIVKLILPVLGDAMQKDIAILLAVCLAASLYFILISLVIRSLKKT